MQIVQKDEAYSKKNHPVEKRSAQAPPPIQHATRPVLPDPAFVQRSEAVVDEGDCYGTVEKQTCGQDATASVMSAAVGLVGGHDVGIRAGELGIGGDGE